MGAFSQGATIEMNLISNESIKDNNRTTTCQQGTIVGANNREILCLRGHPTHGATLSFTMHAT